MAQPSSRSSLGKRPKKKQSAGSSATQPSVSKQGPTKPAPTKPSASSGVKPTPAQSSQPSSSSAQKREQRREITPQRAQQQQRRRKRGRSSNRGLWLTLGGVVVAVAAIIALFIVLGHQASNTGSTYPVTAADPTVMKQVTSVDSSVLAQVGTGSGKVQTKPTKLNGASALTGPTGKPEVFYYGAEYCPFCAAERWPLIVALSRFGTFSNLSQTTSSSTDVYPNTPTFSFYHSSYTSQYIDFVPLEVESYRGVTLQTPTSAQQQIINQYNPNQSFPFISFANRYTINGASYDPQVLNSLDWQAIASALSNPQSPIAQSILGTANYMTAAICQATNQQPASVCQAAPIPEVQQSFGASTGNTEPAGNSLLALVAEMPATGRRGR
jgi:thiol-disulfide isomerase/thioredoxin